MYESTITLGLFFLGLLITIVAQIKVTSSYKKFKKININKNITGFEVARKILDANNLENIHIVETRGTLSDHYDPSRKVIRLSHDIFHGSSVAAVSVAAHEVGHAIQDKENYSFMKIRSFLAPIVSFITYTGYVVAFISLIFGFVGYIEIGILLILTALIFQLITLPVEFDASKRAKMELDTLGIVNDDEAKNVKTMLTSAAMTYVASVVSSVLNLLRLVLIFTER